jgi:hypothetical protein
VEIEVKGLGNSILNITRRGYLTEVLAHFVRAWWSKLMTRVIFHTPSLFCQR